MMPFTDLRNLIEPDGARGHSDYAQCLAWLREHPGQWGLIYVGQQQFSVPSARVGFVTALHKRKVSDSSVYYRMYLRTNDVGPRQLKLERRALPTVTAHDMTTADQWALLRLPSVDMTDRGFLWTHEELDDATNVARAWLFEGVPIPDKEKVTT